MSKEKKQIVVYFPCSTIFKMSKNKQAKISSNNYVNYDDGPKGLDMVNRDPNSLNTFVRVTPENVIAEPGATYGLASYDGVWKSSNWWFLLGKDACYQFPAMMCLLCLALVG